MKTHIINFRGALLLMYIVFFTTAAGSFSSFACKQGPEKAKKSYRQAANPSMKKNKMQVTNPLEVLTSKFI